jgi:hypothetical protein
MSSDPQIIIEKQIVPQNIIPLRIPQKADVLSCKYRMGSGCARDHQLRAELSSGFSTYYCPKDCPYMVEEAA